ncbi:MAG: hypothetical protein ABI686_05950 [Acidobacteriota bacterium]
MRGTKLKAWRVPQVWRDLQENNVKIPENSSVPKKQKYLSNATQSALDSIAEDIRGGLLETVGVESSFSIDVENRCSMILELPAGTDAKAISEAIDAENVEAWLDDSGKVRLGISSWLSTKDIDQTVLCTIKVIHVLLGIHASDNAPPKSFGQKIKTAVMDVMNAQKSAEK